MTSAMSIWSIPLSCRPHLASDSCALDSKSFPQMSFLLVHARLLNMQMKYLAAFALSHLQGASLYINLTNATVRPLRCSFFGSELFVLRVTFPEQFPVYKFDNHHCKTTRLHLKALRPVSHTGWANI